MAQSKHLDGPWLYRDGMILAAGDWTDEKGKKHHDFRYPIVIAHVSESWDQHQHGNMLAAAPEIAKALSAMLAREQQRYANTEAGHQAFQERNAEARAALAASTRRDGPVLREGV